MRLLALIVAAVVVASVSASAEDVTKIETSASMTVWVPADHVELTIGVSAKGDRAKDAAARVSATLNNVRDALAALGLDRNNMPSAGYSVGANEGYQEPGTDRKAYSASSSLWIELAKIDQLGAVVDAALAAGANQVSNITFVPKDREQARAMAIDLAVQKARRDAEVLAKASGAALGRLISLSTTRNTGYGVVDVQSTRTREPRTYIPAPDIAVQAYVYAEWALEK